MATKFTQQEIVLLKQTLLLARQMANMCFNGKQQDRMPEDYRKSMEFLGVRFDAAMGQYTQHMRKHL